MKLKLPFLHQYQSKGIRYTYYRRGDERQRIHGDIGSPEWMQNYNRIHESFNTMPVAHGPGTLNEVITRYRASPDFRQLAEKTRSGYGKHLDYFGETWGDLQVVGLKRPAVIGLKEKFQETPSKANAMLRTLKIILNYAIELGMIDTNPASRIKQLKTGQHRPWEEWEIDQYRLRFPEPTKERMAFELLLNLGQRRGDTAKMTSRDWDGDFVSVIQEKTGTRVYVKASNDLLEIAKPYLEQHDHIALLTTTVGNPMTGDYFGKFMAATIKEAGLTGVVIHGLRYSAATRLREVGCSDDLIRSITGHQSAQMLEHYTRQKRDSSLAVERLNQAVEKRSQNKSG